MFKLLLSQEINTIAYTFKETGIAVYSFEEALYHAYHHWQQSADDVASDAMCDWVQQLGHTNIAAKIKAMHTSGYMDRIIAFISCADYFSGDEITSLVQTLKIHEQKFEWERIKKHIDKITKSESASSNSLIEQIKSSEEANLVLLTQLSALYRKENLPEQAWETLALALKINPDDLGLQLEQARVIKSMGRIRDYQTSLSDIVTRLKKNYKR